MVGVVVGVVVDVVGGVVVWAVGWLAPVENVLPFGAVAVVVPLLLVLLEDEDELPWVLSVVEGEVSLSFVVVFVVPPPAGCAFVVGVLDAVGVAAGVLGVVGCAAGVGDVVGVAGSPEDGGVVVAAVVAPTPTVESTWLTGAACVVVAVATWAAATRFATARCACETGTRLPSVE